MTLHIAFQGGTHGHFLRYFLDCFSTKTPEINESPFTSIGTSHNQIKYSNSFSKYHPIEVGFKNMSEPHCVITLSEKDILQLQRTVYIRPADMNLDLESDYVKLIGFNETFTDPISIQNLYGQTVNETVEVPRFIFRDFIKLGFSDLENHGYIVNNKKIKNAKFENVYYFPVNNFWEKDLFFKSISELDKKFNLKLLINDRAFEIYNEFIKKIPQLKTQHRCKNIISHIKEGKYLPIKNLDIVEEAYIYSWIETTYKNILAPFTNTFFQNTKDIIEYIKWYPHFYHGMNPTLPK